MAASQFEPLPFFLPLCRFCYFSSPLDNLVARCIGRPFFPFLRKARRNSLDAGFIKHSSSGTKPDFFFSSQTCCDRTVPVCDFLFFFFFNEAQGRGAAILGLPFFFHEQGRQSLGGFSFFFFFFPSVIGPYVFVPFLGKSHCRSNQFADKAFFFFFFSRAGRISLC